MFSFLTKNKNKNKNKKSPVDKSWGNPMIRTRAGAGAGRIDCGKVIIDFGIMSFYEHGPEYDMNKVVRRKNKPMYYYSLPRAVEGGYDIAGVMFKFPEDFLSEDQIPKKDTIAYWNKVKEDKENTEMKKEDIESNQQSTDRHVVYKNNYVGDHEMW
jgi:hypothetical protein